MAGLIKSSGLKGGPVKGIKSSSGMKTNETDASKKMKTTKSLVKTPAGETKSGSGLKSKAKAKHKVKIPESTKIGPVTKTPTKKGVDFGGLGNV